MDWTVKLDKAMKQPRIVTQTCGIRDAYDSVVDKAKASLANARAATYKNFTSKAISHKAGQCFHRMLKKRVGTVARRAAKARIMTSADPSHVEVQIKD